MFMIRFLRVLIIFLFAVLCGYARDAEAATVAQPKNTPLEISGWIPYWRKATGTLEAMQHLDTFKEINLFGYTVKQDGTLFDAMKIDEEPWPTLLEAAYAKKVRIIPTVMWANGDAIHATLKSPAKRKAHIKAIVDMVKANDFDGVDIDYEGKKAETRPYFSLFLKELYAAMGKKWVMCTIEARTPLTSRFDTIPKDIEYANDFVAINRYCDRVRIMAYDQGSVDIRLNAKGGPYVPVADIAWVEKVMNLAAQTISKKKLVVGVATYGYEYAVTPLSEYGYRYDLQWAFNPRYALELAAKLGITPERNRAGELSFSYTPSSTTTPLVATATDSAASNNIAPASTSFSDGGIGQASPNPAHILWWSDAGAIAEKVKLAKKLGLRGVAIFKIDGGGDPALWDVLK